MAMKHATCSRKSFAIEIAVFIVAIVAIFSLTIPGRWILALRPIGSLLLTTVLGLMLVTSAPSLVIGLIGKLLKVDKYRCEGIEGAGRLLGYAERSLIFLIFLIAFYHSLEGIGLHTILIAIALLFTGKAIGFIRFAELKGEIRTEEAERRIACTEWFMLGTLISFALAVAISWILLIYITS